jgi:hypothetical protein
VDDFVKLARKSIEYYLDTGSYLEDYDEKFSSIHHGVVVRITNQDREKGKSGSIYPTRENTGLDIIHESINAGFFDMTYLPITKENLDDHTITVYEFTDIMTIKYIEDFGDFDGIAFNFMDENYIFFRKDYQSDLEMFTHAIREANLDSWDIFTIEKFKVNIHK